MRSEDGQMVRLEDYRPAGFEIPNVELDISLFEGHADIHARLSMQRREGATGDLLLDGEELELLSIALNGEAMAPGAFVATEDGLTVRGLPERGAFTLDIRTRVHPETNSKLMGLYRSKGVWATQCEAEGFRRITYFLDRPDVLSRYRVRVEADRRAAPILLSNGNPAEAGDLPDGRHFAVWDDPHPKPSYLFALVAGDLEALRDGFTTASGRAVELAIYTEKGLSRRATYAMDALKRSMRWDEVRFGREYDLDIFNIVAVSDFNMGAMENKGLNIFNHKYILLDPDTATDGDYAGVETVVAHEYFHNWTGNRITCRDWFQLCLKEGLTVYRDQEFTSDERSATVKRVASVRALKAQQFPEDQGPLQHPVRPSAYRAIDNFYTATVYDKGSELVRMIAAILGRDGFRAGMDLYFERHDGEATTIEAFLACFEEASGRDLTQFALWYAQAGTPELKVSETFNNGRLTLTLEQSLRKGTAGTGTEPMHMPVRFALVSRDGTELAVDPTAGETLVSNGVIHLTGASATIVFEGLTERPLVSILRDFSAPVVLRFDQSHEDRLALARIDPDPYGRWSALSDLVGDMLSEAGRGSFDAGQAAPVLEAMADAALDRRLDPALRALMAAIPSEGEIARLIGQDVDPERVHEARHAALVEFGRIGAARFEAARADLASPRFSPDAASAGARALRNALLAPLCLARASADDAAAQFDTATNMTDRFEALVVLAHHFPDEPATRRALDAFFERFRDDELVLDKWFTVQASAPHEGAIDDAERLSRHPAFRLSNPNRARALIGGLASSNPRAFNRADGAGYRFAAGKLAELDALNPQTAARLANAFRSFRMMEPGRRAQAAAALESLRSKQLSKDLQDIVVRTLQ